MSDKKKRGKKFLIAFFVFLFLTFLMLLIGYLYFETGRLSLYGVKPFSDIKSYAASLMEKVPILSSKVKYKPLNVIPYQQLLNERLQAFQEILDTQAASLEKERIKLQALEKKLEELRTSLEASQTALKKKIQSFEEKMKLQQSYEYRLQTLDTWITNSDPTKIGAILAKSKIPINVLVDAFVKLQPKTVGSLLQSIAQTNPTLAASIVYNLAEGKR